MYIITVTEDRAIPELLIVTTCMKKTHIVKIFIILFLPSAVFSAEDINRGNPVISGRMLPVFYPEGTISNERPCFIWYDKYNERDKTDRAQYRITLWGDHSVDPVLFQPDCYENHYYFLFPVKLSPGEYHYKIERLLNNNPDESAFLHYLKYPVTGFFKLDPQEGKSPDLPPEYLISYLSLEKTNRLVNRNNSIFFAGAGAGALGIGMLFYFVFDFGIISSIIYYISFAASGTGFAASGYYAYRYNQEKNQLQKLPETGEKISIYGRADNNIISADIRLSF